MATWIEALLDLQEVDLQIRNLKLRLAMIPKERNDLKEQINNEKEEWNETNHSNKETELKLKGYESLMIKNYDAIAKLQKRSY